MHNKRTTLFLGLFALIILLTLSYPYLDKQIASFFEDDVIAQVARVVDGDTLVTEEGETIRMLGINTPERGEVYYQEAKEALETTVLGQEVKLLFSQERYDKYGRGLAYVFLDGVNINEQQVAQGLATFYFPTGRDSFYQDFKAAWEQCVEDGQAYLCEASPDPCTSCITIGDINTKEQSFSLTNTCSQACIINDWEIKAEGRKKVLLTTATIDAYDSITLVFGKTVYKEGFFSFEEKNLLNKIGDTIFVKDKEAHLIAWVHY